MKTIRINEQFLQGAVQMELNGLGENRVKSVEIVIINERLAEISLNWEYWPFYDAQSFNIRNYHTLDDLREVLKFELLNIENRIAELLKNASVSSDPTTEKD